MENDRPMTKRELKAARRAEKVVIHKEESKQSMVRWGIIGVASIAFLGFFAFMVVMLKKDAPTVGADPVEFTSEAWTIGADDSNVVLTEFADLQCPACQAYHPIIKEILASYEEGEVRFDYMHFPLTSIHPNAMPAAKAAEAAGAQGKFFEYHDMLFDKQTLWSNLNAPAAREVFIEYAQELELDIEEFESVMDDAAIETKIRANMDEGISAGVSGTPSFFINGKRISTPQNIDVFKSIIDEELGKTGEEN